MQVTSFLDPQHLSKMYALRSGSSRDVAAGRGGTSSGGESGNADGSSRDVAAERGGTSSGGESGSADDSSRDVLLIDPIVADTSFITYMESNSYRVCGAALTQARTAAVEGIRSMAKIYGDFPVYAAVENVAGFPTINLAETQVLSVAGFELRCHNIHQYRSDYLLFEAGGFLFTGSMIRAGELDLQNRGGSELLLIARVWEFLESRPGHQIILPAGGPPTTVDAELRWSRGFLDAMKYIDKAGQNESPVDMETLGPYLRKLAQGTSG